MSGTLAQALKFALVGVFNTVLDFLIFNLAKKKLNWGAVAASYLSTSIAMVVSFFLNKLFVFEARGVVGTGRQALYFFPATIFSLYVIHNGTIWILTKKWRWPVDLGLKIVRKISALNRFSDDFVVDNAAKLAATALSLITNFILYKFIVFA